MKNYKFTLYMENIYEFKEITYICSNKKVTHKYPKPGFALPTFVTPGKSCLLHTDTLGSSGFRTWSSA